MTSQKRSRSKKNRTALGARRGLTVKKSSTGFSASSYLFDIYPEISFRQAGGAGKSSALWVPEPPGGFLPINRNYFRLR